MKFGVMTVRSCTWALPVAPDAVGDKPFVVVGVDFLDTPFFRRSGIQAEQAAVTLGGSPIVVDGFPGRVSSETVEYSDGYATIYVVTPRGGFSVSVSPVKDVQGASVTLPAGSDAAGDATTWAETLGNEVAQSLNS